MFKPEGIFPALVTPFTNGKAVNENRLRFLVNRFIELGVHGVVPCSTIGEFGNITIERKQVIKAVVDGTIPKELVHPSAVDRQCVYINNFIRLCATPYEKL